MSDNLMARLGLDTTGFKAGLKNAESALGSFTGTLGAAVSVAGLQQATRAVTEYGAKIYDLGERFGVSTTTIQQFGNAAEKNGSSLEGMTMGFNKLEISQSRALEGSQKQIDAFANLGITMQDLRTLSPEQLMLKLGKSSMDAADMVALLGKTALQLRPVLRGLADGSIDLGVAMDKGMIKKLKEADTLYKTLWEHIRVYGAEVLVGIADDFKNLATIVTSSIEGMWKVITGKPAEAAKQYKVMMAALSRVQDELLNKGIENRAKDDADAEASAAKKRKFALAPDEDESKSKKTAEDKDADRTKLSLKELSGLDLNQKNQSFRNNIQAVFASRQAREVERLEAESKKAAKMQDPAGAKRLLDQADQMRQSIPGLKESEKEVGAYTKALDASTRLKSIDAGIQSLSFESE